MNESKKTINEKELETLAFWKKEAIFESSVETPAGNTPKDHFSFYDGPPFATGTPHHGSLMAGTVKDIIPRYQTMKGNRVERIWGWDCHGLPIENLIEKKLGLASKKDIESFGTDKFNHEAFSSVMEYDHVWKEVVPRIGRFVDMEHAYKTMDATYTESVWWSWKTLYEKGLAYEGNKMMHICPRCETPLAQSEVGLEYHDVTDLSVTARFKLVDEPSTYILAWTTTPWTLPGNTALAVHKDIEYVKIRNTVNGSHYIVAKKYFFAHFAHASTKEVSETAVLGERYTPLEKIQEEGEEFEFVGVMNGSEFVGKSYIPPFTYYYDNPSFPKENGWKVWHADFITEDTGTGIAHEAPAFGAEDMELAIANNIPIIKHVKMDGTFVPEVTDFAGMKVKQKDDTMSADIEIVKYLAAKNLLFEKHKIVHSYPLCWRCATPLLNYATSSWFIDVPKLKDRLVESNKTIGWTPEHIRDGRFGKWLEGAREWAVSRSRYWGAPLPVWKSESGKVKVVGSLKELAELRKDKPKNTYYVMRHGESMSNVAGVLENGESKDNHLTDNGKEQVQAQIETLRKAKIDLIISSPVLRAKETADIVAQALGVPVVENILLTEHNTGIYSGRTLEEYVNSLSRHGFLRLDTRPEGGETHQEVMNRVMKCLMEMEATYKDKHILFVTHGGPVRMMLAGAHLLTQEEILKDESEARTYYPKNAEVKQVTPLLVPRDDTGAINLHRPHIDTVKLLIDSEEYTRIGDVFDCWYESGSMPFAQLHYPFENEARFKTNYPADFIAEGMDQTRGWFYSLLVLGVGLFNQSPYKHVICNGIINAADGEKISKSKKNYTDPMALVEKFGADAFRYYLMTSPVVKGESINFKDEDLEAVYKKVVLRLENVLDLYLLYKKDDDKEIVSVDPLDAWILARLQQVIQESSHGFTTFCLDEALRPIELFVDDLSVWYVRRSRERIKGQDGHEARASSLTTLRHVLGTFARVLAPSMPFIAERMYQAVTKEKSVHLASWPDGLPVNETIIKDMACAREASSIGLMERNKEKIPVRQPLRNAAISGVPDYLLPLVQDEINTLAVKSVPGEGVTVVLDTMLDKELLRLGDLRTAIRALQEYRKSRRLHPSDRITLVADHTIFLEKEIERVCNASVSIGEVTDGATLALSFGDVHFR